MIRTLVFDFGGVIMEGDNQRAIRCFKEVGFPGAEEYLDPYTLRGVFGQLEEGLVDEETFRREVSRLACKELSMDDCCYGMQGYVNSVPMRNLHMLQTLRSEGYRLLLLSNTNPFMMKWARSKEFSGDGRSLDDFFDHLYLSYQMKCMKPSPLIFEKLLEAEHLKPEEAVFTDDGERNIATARQLGFHTLQAGKDCDWVTEIRKLLR